MKHTFLKRLFTSSIALLMVFSVFGSMQAASTVTNIPQVKSDPINLDDEYSIVPSDTDRFIEECGWEKPTPDAKLIKVVHVRDSQAPTANSSDLVEPMASSVYVKKTGGEFPLCGTTVRARTSGVGDAQGVLTLSQSVQVANTFKSNVTVSASVVSAAVGFDVAKTWNSTASYAVTTNGKDYQIVAYDDYQGQNFEVWEDPLIGFDKLIGTGTAMRQVGFCFAIWQL